MAYTIESSYKPLSFQELATPYMMYKDAYDKQEANMESLYDKANVFSDLDDLPEDSKARKIYDNYMDTLNKANQDFAANGLTMNNRGLFNNIRKRYQGEIGRLEQAKTKLDDINKLRMSQSMQDPSMIYSQDNISIDDMLGKTKPNMFGISGRYLYDLGSKAGATSSSRIWSDVDIKNTANKYYLLASQSNGYTPEMLAKMREDFMAIPEFRKEVENAMQANGVTKNLSGDKYNQAALNFVNGFVDSCTYKRNDNLQQNPGVLNAAQEESKREFEATKAMQQQQFDAKAQMEGFVKQKDGTYKYDMTQDPSMQKAVQVAQIKAAVKGGNNGSSTKTTASKGNSAARVSQNPDIVHIKYRKKDNTYSTDVLNNDGTNNGDLGTLVEYGKIPKTLRAIINRTVLKGGDPSLYDYYLNEDGDEVWTKPRDIKVYNNTRQESGATSQHASTSSLDNEY